MKILREAYDFVTGGSIVAPAGLAAAVLIAEISTNAAPQWRAGLFACVLLLTFIASTLEQVK